MSIGALRAEADDHLGPVEAKATHDVADEAVSYRLDLLDLLQPTVRVVEHFQEANAELSRGVAQLELPNITQSTEISCRAPVPEPSAAAGHREERDVRTFGSVTGDRGGATETLVVGMWHHYHQSLAVTRHREQV